MDRTKDTDADELQYMNSERHTFILGDETIYLDISAREHTHILYLNVHENEQTSVTAAKQVLENKAGILAELKSKKERLISFNKNSQSYSFDPNRMFSTVGIKASLEEYGTYDEETATEVFVFATEILNAIKKHAPTWIVALHNTSGEYSIAGYQEGGLYQKDSAGLFVNDKYAPGDFFFTSDAEAFTAIKNEGYNVVLQDNLGVTDDGSLSVYCGKNGIRYINIEVLHGHLNEQVEMITFVQGWLLSLRTQR